MTSALKLRTILTIKLLAAAQALEFAKPLEPSEPLRETYRKVREIVPFTAEDLAFSPLIENLLKKSEKII